MDSLTKRQRSAVMAKIRSRGNRATELRFIDLLRRAKITGWRRHQPVFGKPDFIFSKRRVAVFVDGCFWHACPRHCRMPAGNRAFWRAKLARNQARDRLVTRTLRKAGGRVLRIWEHTLRWATTKRGGRKVERGMGRLLRRIQQGLAGRKV